MTTRLDGMQQTIPHVRMHPHTHTHTHTHTLTHTLIHTHARSNIPSLGGGVGYGAEAEDCWLVERSDLPESVWAALRLPIDTVGTAPWMAS